MRQILFSVIFLCFILSNLNYCSTYRVVVKDSAVQFRLPEKFDDTRDPAFDLEQVVLMAKKQNKKIILDVGGEWCIWCKRIDQFISSNEKVNAFLDKHFIILKVNYSKENKNEDFLEQYPRIKGYPHFFVLDKNGKLLHSQDTGELEDGDGYSEALMLKFLNKWK